MSGGQPKELLLLRGCARLADGGARRHQISISLALQKTLKMQYACSPLQSPLYLELGQLLLSNRTSTTTTMAERRAPSNAKATTQGK